MDIEQSKDHYEAMIEGYRNKVLNLLGLIQQQCVVSSSFCTREDDSLVAHLDVRVDVISQSAVKLQEAAGELRMYKALLLQLKEISAVGAV